MQPSSLPSPRLTYTLFLLLTHLYEPEAESPAFNAELTRLGPHLKVLGLSHDIAIQDATWKALQSVDTFVCDSAEAFEAISSRHHPSTLRRIVVVPRNGGPFATYYLLPYIRSSKAFLKPVQVFQVPPMDAASEGERQEREQLFSLCKELEIEIHESRDAHFDSWAAYLDELLSLW